MTNSIKVINSAKRVLTAVNQILDGFDIIEAEQEMLGAEGVDIVATFDAAIQADATLNHALTSTYANVMIYFNPQIITAIKEISSGVPAQNAWNALQQIRN